MPETVAHFAHAEDHPRPIGGNWVDMERAGPKDHKFGQTQGCVEVLMGHAWGKQSLMWCLLSLLISFPMSPHAIV